ncbi:MAG: extracellular solute-binding protein [Anaerolineae bacterium]
MLKKMVFALLLTLLIFTISAPLSGQEAEDPVSGTIRVWGWEGPLQTALERSGVLADFKAAYPDVRVEVTLFSPPALYEALRTGLAEGTPVCDVCLVEDKEVGGFVQSGQLADLTDLIAPYVDRYTPARLAQAEEDGRYYAMPWDSGPVVMFYRRDVFEKAGIPSEPEVVDALVSTWEDYLDICRLIVARTGQKCFPHNRADNNARLYRMVLWSRGLGFYDENGSIVIDSPEHIETLEMLGQFWAEDLVSNALDWTDVFYAEFSSLENATASLIHASWMEGQLKRRLAPGTEGLWGVVRMPAYEEGGTRAASDGGSDFLIPAASENLAAARAFVEYVLGSEDNLARMAARNGSLPAMLTALDQPVFNEADPFFAGQLNRQLYASVLPNIPLATMEVPEHAILTPHLVDNVRLYALGELTAEEALRAAADGMRAELAAAAETE